MNKYELIALLEAHGKAAVAAGVENNFKGNEPKRQKHIQEMDRLEKMIIALEK